MLLKTILRLGLLICGLVPISLAAEPVAAAMQSELAKAADRELHTNILPFWLKHAPDRETGGFYGQVTAELAPVKSAPRGALLTSRILWTFSAAYVRDRNPEFIQMAHRAYDDLLTRFWDNEHGGLYWTVTAEGKPLDTTKQIYGQVFGIYALSEYYRATSEPAALERAIVLYRLVEKQARDVANGGYFEVFSNDWRREQPRKSLVNPFAAKSQNTHLHVMEAYTNLLRVWPDTELKENLRALLKLMLTQIYDSKTHHLRLFLSDDWKLKSEQYSYGHDIEAAWLMTEAAATLGDKELGEQTRVTALAIAETTLKEGIDGDGGVFNEGGIAGVSDFQKDWWPQAEAVVGFLNAYQISGDKRFLDAAIKTWRFIERRVADHIGGEWFEFVARNGTPCHTPKINLWKCPYHNSRACLEIMARLEEPMTASGRRAFTGKADR